MASHEMILCKVTIRDDFTQNDLIQNHLRQKDLDKIKLP
jgi:hypothetical protein